MPGIALDSRLLGDHREGYHLIIEKRAISGCVQISLPGCLSSVLSFYIADPGQADVLYKKRMIYYMSLYVGGTSKVEATVK